jgi:oligopeptide/dipeptide ABC transporter ATP-binding protein
MTNPLLQVENLTTTYRIAGREVAAIDRVSFSCERGDRLGVVGESGSGKSVLALSLLNLIRAPGRIASGRIRFKGKDILLMGRGALRDIRGGGISMIFQDAGGSLTPVYPIGTQLIEVIRAHLSITRIEAQRRAIELLSQVGIPEPELRMSAMPNELSGGMKQRVAIALALSSEPDLLIADDPTSAVDVTIQAQILKLLNQLVEERGLALIFVSHDFRVVSTISERLLILYAGRIMEQGKALSIFRAPRHPYTRALLACSPTVEEYRFPFSTLPGTPPNPLDEPIPGCPFHPRCPSALAKCASNEPMEEESILGHRFSCWNPGGNEGLAELERAVR